MFYSYFQTVTAGMQSDTKDAISDVSKYVYMW